MNIILYLLQIIQYLYQQNIWLINFICKYIPLKQWAFDDAHSPKYAFRPVCLFFSTCFRMISQPPGFLKTKPVDTVEYLFDNNIYETAVYRNRS